MGRVVRPGSDTSAGDEAPFAVAQWVQRGDEGQRQGLAWAPLRERGRSLVILVLELKGRGVILCSYYLNERRENNFSVKKCNGMVVSVNVYTFQWYFTGTSSFNGIFRKLSSLNGTQPIFPYIEI